jgi:hypothetical protein
MYIYSHWERQPFSTDDQNSPGHALHSTMASKSVRFGLGNSVTINSSAFDHFL